VNDTDDWLTKLYALLLRYPQLGAAADVSGMTKAEQWGLYCHLLRRAALDA
jgi:hypothetical protein